MLMKKILDFFKLENTGIKISKDLDIDYDFLNKIYDGTKSKRREELVARDILSTIGFCTAGSLCNDAIEYLSEKHSRIETCVYAAELCTPPINNNELYIVSGGYIWAGAKYRKEAMYWIQKYIQQGAISDYVSSYESANNDGIVYDQRIRYIAIAHIDLAQLYAREYRFQDAIDELYISLEIDPYMIGPYATIPMYCVKMNDYKKAYEFLNQEINSIIYKYVPEIKNAIDTAMKNTQDKQNRGYTYKPRIKSEHV